MLQVFLHSPDPKMYPLLASALKPDCAIVSDNSLERLKQAAHSAQPNVLVLDFDSNYYNRDQQLAIYDSIADLRSPVVVMTDDLRPSTVVEFIQRGAFDYIRKPPSLLEFKVVVRRAHEHLLMKIELERMRETLNVAQRCDARSEEHTSELQSRRDLVCRLLLEKK